MIATFNMRASICAALALGACLVLGACDTRGSAGSVTPGGTLGNDSELRPEGEFEGESIDELALRLDRLATQMRATVTAGTQSPDKCEELCELSQAICEIKGKMCEIADERVSDDDYQNLCRKAKQRCQEASQSCVRCVEHHQQGTPGLEPEPGCGGEPTTSESR